MTMPTIQVPAPLLPAVRCAAAGKQWQTTNDGSESATERNSLIRTEHTFVDVAQRDAL